MPYFADYPVSSIKSLDIRNWQNQLKNNDKLFSPYYLNKVNGLLRTIFNYSVKYFDLPKNPVIGERLGKSKPNEKNFWTIEEFENFICCVNNEPLAYIIFNILFWTGLRVGEVLALTLDDFDSQKKFSFY